MEAWAKDSGLSFSANKTKVMLFTRKTKKMRKLRLYIQGQEIEQVNSFKYLGITLDSKLHWNLHMDNITK